MNIFVEYNNNPNNILVDDCVIRALSTALGKSWDNIYLELMIEGFKKKNYPNYNSIWWSYLEDRGYHRKLIPDTCPMCYTLKQFTKDRPRGIYIVGDGSHVVAVVDGVYVDTWDSGNIPVLYYFHI